MQSPQTVQVGISSMTLAASEYEADLRVAARRPVADGVIELELQDAHGHALPAWDPGAHVDLVLGDGIVRQYSLTGDPTDRSAWRVAVLLEPEGRGGSRYVHEKLIEGSVVRVRGPRNHFALEDAPEYLFVAGGIGITPIIPMIRRAIDIGATWRLVYGGRRRATMAYTDELERLGSAVTVQPEDQLGMLDLDTVLGTVRPGTLIYCCGPEPLLKAVEGRCMQWHPGALHVERFTAKPLAEPALSDSFEVYLAQSDITVTVPEDKSILEVIEASGIEALASCEEGVCGTCEAAVLEGEPDHRDSILTEEDRAKNDCMMICVSRSRGPRLVLDL